ncbi:MAG TPA: 4a-hydroxytetrahydrobiopterin dehydratase [Steroidobacteraceae bacterium]|nr:4a-hydroxytetrahydrobiopterin dehydratase [Steroidobacteraceae bacterium]HRX89143.1 4a-hydroxytetrahydrobiopterin dehydratase [Steroidobacteraceae bacterium]
MTTLTTRKCVPCEGGVTPLTRAGAEALLQKLHPHWRLATDTSEIRRAFSFPDFYHTMSFVNAVAHIANTEDHHPDLEVGYNYCRIRYQTHAINGLHDNDFICAAKIDQLTDQ